MGFFFGKKDKEPHKLPCRQRDNYLSATEQALYRVLRLAVGDTFSICPKVNFRDIFCVDQPHKNIDLNSQIERRQITFLLCDIATMRPELGLELDESPPEQHEKSEEDFLVEEIFEAAGMPYVRMYAAATYNPNDLRERVFEAVSTEHEPEEGAPDQEYEEHGGYTGPDGKEEIPATWKEQSIWDNRQPSGDSLGKPVVDDDPGISPDKGWRRDESPAVEGNTVQPAVPEDAAAGAELPAEESAATRPAWEKHDTAGDTRIIDEKPRSEKEVEGQEPAGTLLQPGDSKFARPKTSPEKPGSFVSQFDQEFKRKMEDAAAAASQKTAPLCPNCQILMELRTSKRSIKFYSCTNFPRCKEFKGLLE